MNTYLLAKFAKDIRFGADIKSTLRRNQYLAIIYLHLTIPIMILVFSFFLSLFGIHNTYLLFVIYTSIAILAFQSLKYKKPEIGAAIGLINLHILLHCGNLICDLPLACMCVQALFPNFALVLNVSKETRFGSHVLSLIQFSMHLKRVLAVFQETLIDDQLYHIYKFLFVAILMYLLLALTAHISKTIEDDMWTCAQADYNKFQSLTEEVVQAVAAKDVFISSLSHEIRNPLNSMNGSINYLLDVVKDKNYVSVLRNAKMSSEILLNLLNNALDAAKLKSEKMEISCSETSLESVIKKVFIINSENLKKQKITAQAFIDSALPPLIWIDPHRILQILMNLVSNAIKFTNNSGYMNIHVKWTQKTDGLLSRIHEDYSPPAMNKNQKSDLCLIQNNSMMAQYQSVTKFDSTIFKECTVEEQEKRLYALNYQYHQRFKPLSDLGSMHTHPGFSDQESCWNIKYSNLIVSNDSKIANPQNNKGYLKVQISDTGCGISPEHTQKLFGMFAQAHQGIAQRYGGTGLGLWICKQLCQKMGGDIAVYSQLNKGTQFVFYIPIDYNRVSTNVSPTIPSSISHRVTGLVVDDYSFNRDLHKLILEREGVQVTLASDGKEAVSKYQSKGDGHFDFIMMDIQMPEMDGFTAAKIIRRWEKVNNRKKADIYFVSGEYYNEDGLLAEFRTGGGNEEEMLGVRFFKKPIDVQIFRNIIDKYKS